MTASMRRTPWATPASSVILNRPMSPVREDVGAAAELDRVPHAHHADVVAVFLAEERDGAPALGLGDRQHLGLGGDVAQHLRVDQVLDLLPLSAVSGAQWEKSKRSRSGATSEPFWATCSPRTCRSAQWSRCVAEWLRRMASRRSTSTTS